MVESIRRNNSERLYLLKDSTNNVFVNNCELLKQHQIDGLRFLFMQYKKRKPGVIINFPSGCGKSVTVALFLYAVRNLLMNPVLILCNDEHEMYKWKDIFLKWTEFVDDDITIESSKRLKGKKIFINKVDEMEWCRKHCWSTVIIKDDMIKKKTSLISDVEYKIWITSTDMKKDLTMLAFIHNWLHPKIKMDVNDFIPSINNNREIYLKSIYLDAFLEDFVIREENIKAFNTKEKSKTSNTTSHVNSENKSRRSRKNKDATGTKIKRSRRFINDDIIKHPNENEITTINDLGENDDFSINNDNKHNEIKTNDNVATDNISDPNNYNATIEDKTIHNSLEYRRQDLVQNVSTDVAAGNERMKVVFAEQMNLDNSNNEVVKNKNIIQTENSTESIDSDDDNIKIDEDLDIVKENMDVNENNDIKQGLHNSINITQSKQNEETKEEKYIDVIDNVHTGIDKTNQTVIRHKDLDTKLSELEERTLKKFKGSFLDSIF